MGVPSKNAECTPTGARRRACFCSILRGPHHGDFCEWDTTISPIVQDTGAQTGDVTDGSLFMGFCVSLRFPTSILFSLPFPPFTEDSSKFTKMETFLKEEGKQLRNRILAQISGYHPTYLDPSEFLNTVPRVNSSKTQLR